MQAIKTRVAPGLLIMGVCAVAMLAIGARSATAQQRTSTLEEGYEWKLKDGVKPIRTERAESAEACMAACIANSACQAWDRDTLSLCNQYDTAAPGKPVSIFSVVRSALGVIGGGTAAAAVASTPESAIASTAASTQPTQPSPPLAAQVAVSQQSRSTPSGNTFRDCPQCPEMVIVPAGTITVGAQNGDPEELPAQQVTFKQRFAIGKFEVTRDEFEQFARETNLRAADKCTTLRDGKMGTFADRPGFSFRDPGFPQDGRHPVVCVRFHDAKTYVAWLAKKTGKPYRLPSETEWEYAARAGTSTRYHFGDNDSELCAYGNHADASVGGEQCNDGHKYTAPAGSYKPNPWGLHDMHGNVAEWVEDCRRSFLDKPYTPTPPDGRAFVQGERGIPADIQCQTRVYRGGSWSTWSEVTRSRERKDRDVNWAPVSNLGFRVALSVDQMPQRVAAPSPAGAVAQASPPALPANAAAIEKDRAECIKNERRVGDQTARNEACTRAIESGRYRDKDLAELYAHRGHGFSFMGNDARAVSEWDRVFEIYPGYDVDYIYYRGERRMYLGDRDGAIRDMRLYLEKYQRLLKNDIGMAREMQASRARAALQAMGAAPPAPPADAPLPASAAACQRLSGQQLTASGVIQKTPMDMDIKNFTMEVTIEFHDAKTRCPMVYRHAGEPDCYAGKFITVSGRVKYSGRDQAYEVVVPRGAKARCQVASAPSSAPPAMPVAAVSAPGRITIVSATLGANCNGVNPGNVTDKVAAICNGKETCALPGTRVNNPDPAFGCPKAFAAEWQCSGSPGTRKRGVPAIANEKHVLTMSCK